MSFSFSKKYAAADYASVNDLYLDDLFLLILFLNYSSNQ